jgi:transcriptional regulator with XRE-family HTH domain
MIGERLRYWREKRMLTMRELGDKAGVSYSTISRIETGRVVPGIDTLIALARALDVHPMDLLPEEEK